MLNIISDFFDAFCENWKSKLISITSDGSLSMTRHCAGVVSWLHQVSLSGCYRVRCAAHQIDLVVQKVFV